MNSSNVVDINSLKLEHEAVEADHLPTDHTAETAVPTTGFIRFDGTDKLNVGVWEHSAGVSTDVEVDEVFVIISGKGRIVLQDGSILHLAPGVVGKLKEGEATRWEIDEPLRKVYITAK